MRLFKIRKIIDVDVIEAVREWGTRPAHKNTIYYLVHDGGRYPAKGIVRQAYAEALQRRKEPKDPLGKDELSGGGGRDGANTILKNLRFGIIKCKKS